MFLKSKTLIKNYLTNYEEGLHQDEVVQFSGEEGKKMFSRIIKRSNNLIEGLHFFEDSHM